MKIDNSTEIISVKIINIDTGEEKELSERIGRRCHFNDVIALGKYFILLRLDWGEIINGEPVLDADIWTENHGRKKIIRKKGSPWHKNIKNYNDKTSQYIYEFKFNNLTLRLVTQKTIAKTYTVDVVIGEKEQNSNEKE